jgi:hypothetical protein
VDDVDRAAEDHAQKRDRPSLLGEDRRARDVELDLRLGGQLAELIGPERNEGRARGEEARDLAQRRVQLGLLGVGM